MHILTANINYS